MTTEKYVAGADETPRLTLIYRQGIEALYQEAVALEGDLAEMRRERDELRLRFSDTPTWRDAAHDPPADEQKVLAWWPASLCVEGYETVIHHAADAPDGPACWHDVHGHAVDAPELWCDHPKAPK